ncbi:MAG: (d)CMP kinase [Anaerolineae bacterium]|nr:MAG: (d)CMP kinase [Anaerolineae bacterium]
MPNIPNPIAIDGPAASGKSTIGRMLADRLDYAFLDTGCMYRAVTLAVLEQNIDPGDEPSVVNVTKNIEIDLEYPPTNSDGRLYSVYLNGKDVTWEIRRSDVDSHVSLISSYKEVRIILVEKQRLLAQRGKVVVVGRDIGTVVLPEAPLKLYIVASPEERARRRWLEQKNGVRLTYEEILEDIIRRDNIDGSRKYSPMIAADDAVHIDTTGLNQVQVIDRILDLAIFHTKLQP